MFDTTNDLYVKNRIIVGQICEKIIANYFADQNIISKINIDPFGWFDLIKILPNGEEKYVQVKGLTPYFKYNYWSIHKRKSQINIKHIFKSDELYIISLPANKSMFDSHESDNSIIRVNTSLINEKDNVVDDTFVLHRDNHIHMYEVVRPLTDHEIKIISEYPTSAFS